MTDEQQRALLKELLGIREGMAMKADLLKLEEGLTGIIVKLVETKVDPYSELRTWMETKDAQIARLTERADRLSNWYQNHADFLQSIHERTALLEDRERGPVASDIAACLLSCAATIRENKMQGWEAAEYIESYASTVKYQAKSVPTPSTPAPKKNSTKTNKEEN